MSAQTGDKYCVILLSMGGPDSAVDVREFLTNIFSDRSIIRLPGGRLLQKPFARFIASRRTPSVQENYKLIGGGSPLLKWTEAQAKQLTSLLSAASPAVKCYVGMRYFRPMTEDAIHQAYRDGFRRMVFLPLYPQYCKATTGSSFEVARLTLQEYTDVQAEFVNDFHAHPGYTELLAEYIDGNIGDDDTLLFSAHSVPQKFVDEGDPYVDQVRRTAAAAAGDREYFVSFQSRTGPVKWVGPDTVDEARRLLNERSGDLFIVPISFVCDHIETLYEIDIELGEKLGPELAPRIKRMPMFNDDKRFSLVLANVLKEKAGAYVTI
jgi:ferrochelatase